MTTNVSSATNEAQIRQLIDDWANAVRGKDLKALESYYVPEFLEFDLAPPLQYPGIDAYGKNCEEWFSSFEGSIGYEIRDLSITSVDEKAFSHSLNRITGKRTNGESTDVWVLATVSFHKIAGKWKIAHEHFSVPFYIESPYGAPRALKS
jgi:ketosteroid isomerase-like protein